MFISVFYNLAEVKNKVRNSFKQFIIIKQLRTGDPFTNDIR